MDSSADQRRRPARRLPGDHRRAQGRRAHDRLRPPVHARLRRLDGRLLHHRRLRRARRLLARLDQPLRDPLRRRARSRSSTAAARARTSSPPPTAATSSRATRPRRSTVTRTRGRWARDPPRGRRAGARAPRGRRPRWRSARSRTTTAAARPTRCSSTTPSGSPRAATSRSPACGPGKTTTFKVVKVGRPPARGGEGRGDRAGARGPAQGRALRDPAAVAHRRVLRGLPAGRLGRAHPGRRPPAGGADQLHDRDRPGERHHAAPLSRAPAPDRRRAGRGPRRPARATSPRCSAARIRRCGRRARRSRSSAARRTTIEKFIGDAHTVIGALENRKQDVVRFVREAGRDGGDLGVAAQELGETFQPPSGLPHRARALHEPPRAT